MIKINSGSLSQDGSRQIISSGSSTSFPTSSS